MIKRHYKSDKESKREKGIGFSSSDPTPALPEREGVRFVTNGANSLPIEHGHDGVNKTGSLPYGEGWDGVTNSTNQTKGPGGRKPGYITANPYTYPIIKDYRKDLKDHQTKTEHVIWEYLRNKKTGHRIRRQHVIGDFITDFV